MTHYPLYSNYKPQSGQPTPDLAVTYIYDAFNRWVGETVTTSSGTTQARYVYDGNQIVMEFDGTGGGIVYDGLQIVTQFDDPGGGSGLTAANLSHRYLWGPAVDRLLSDEQTSGATSGTVVWALGDNQNTVRDLGYLQRRRDDRGEPSRVLCLWAASEPDESRRWPSFGFLSLRLHRPAVERFQRQRSGRGDRNPEQPEPLV